MRNIAEFALIGRIGAIKKVGSTTRVTIASNYSHKDDQGEWQDVAYWNEIVIFSTSLKNYIENHIGKGDLVHARGRIRQSSFEKDGQRVYTVDLACNQFARLAQASDNRADTAQPAQAEQLADTDIPF
jgi:single-strand DNA-binding protein